MCLHERVESAESGFVAKRSNALEERIDRDRSMSCCEGVAHYGERAVVVVAEEMSELMCNHRQQIHVASSGAHRKCVMRCVEFTVVVRCPVDKPAEPGSIAIDQNRVPERCP